MVGLIVWWKVDVQTLGSRLRTRSGYQQMTLSSHVIASGSFALAGAQDLSGTGLTGVLELLGLTEHKHRQSL